MRYYVRTYKLVIGPFPNLARAVGVAALISESRSRCPYPAEILDASQYVSQVISKPEAGGHTTLSLEDWLEQL